MMTGDIMQVAGRIGVWVVLGPAVTAIPPGRRWRCRNLATGSEAVVGDGDISLLLRPDISAGDVLAWRDLKVTVDWVGDDDMRVTLPAEARREPLPGGGHVAFGPGTAVIGRGELVSENVAALLRSQGG